MQDNDIMVSVLMPVYNHEDYVEKAIESVIRQQVNFRYELIIGEDCSTDNSLEMCKRYADQYPEKVYVIEHEKNVGAVENGSELMRKASGKYVIGLEGDDFWCDFGKLQKQVDFLENNKDYVGCGHKFNVVDKYDNEYFDRDFKIQFLEKNPYTIKDYENGFLLSHINTILYRNIYLDKNIDTDFIDKFNNMSGDSTTTAILLLHGKLYCLEDVMSCYRKVIDSKSSSFSAMQEYSNKRDFLFESQIFLENKLGRKIDFTQRKKNIFASAVFKWYREKNKNNFKVVCKIINLSQEKRKYARWFLYLVFIKSYNKFIGKGNERVKF